MLKLGDLEFYTEFKVIAHNVGYTPQRDAPYSCDHDSPRFSDTGDNEEFEADGVSIVIRYPNGSVKTVLLPDFITDYLADEILAVAYEHHQNLLKEI